MEINEWNPVTDETNSGSSAEQDIKSRSMDDITKRERQAQYENERLESELMGAVVSRKDLRRYQTYQIWYR